jgi:hypothetical protein
MKIEGSSVAPLNRLHGVTFHKTTIFIFITVTNSYSPEIGILYNRVAQDVRSPTAEHVVRLVRQKNITGPQAR